MVRIKLMLQPDEVYLNVVMDYIPETIYKIMKYYLKMK